MHTEERTYKYYNVVHMQIIDCQTQHRKPERGQMNKTLKPGAAPLKCEPVSCLRRRPMPRTLKKSPPK